MQDIYHYITTWDSQDPLREVKAKDDILPSRPHPHPTPPHPSLPTFHIFPSISTPTLVLPLHASLHLPSPSLDRFVDYKREKVQSHGDTLVVVPCWWDGEKERFFFFFFLPLLLFFISIFISNFNFNFNFLFFFFF